ncbi:MAG: carboxypeptidase M32, partial [Pseudomonadota bacterium]
VPGLDDQLAVGDTSQATGWLQGALQRYGGLHSPRDTIAQASGMTPGPEPLLAYLQAKFRALYRL